MISMGELQITLEVFEFLAISELAGPRGFEPLPTVLETAVLPLTPWPFKVRRIEYTIFKRIQRVIGDSVVFPGGGISKKLGGCSRIAFLTISTIGIFSPRYFWQGHGELNPGLQVENLSS